MKRLFYALLSCSLILLTGQSFAAFNDAGTDYTNAPQNTWMWSPGMEPLNSLNEILCIMEQTQADEMVNKGNYIAIIDQAKCEQGQQNESGGGSDQSAGAGRIPESFQMIINSTRADNSSDQIVKFWLPTLQFEDGSEAIRGLLTITEETTTSNPYGQFSFTWNSHTNDTFANQIGEGEIKTVPSADLSDGKVGITFLEPEASGSGFSQAASIVKNPDGSDGIALTHIVDSHGGPQSKSAAFALSWNQTNVANRVKVQMADDVASLGYKSGNQDAGSVCLAKDQLKTAVWRYDLFNFSDGSAVSLNSGFPFVYGTNNDKHGYIGYWGVWTEEQNALSNGDSFNKINYATNPPSLTPYTLGAATGRLYKNVLVQLNLTEVGGTEFHYFDNNANPPQEYVVKYKTVNNVAGFYKTHTLEFNNGPPTKTAIDPEELITVDSDRGLFMYSEQLGGSIAYHAGDAFIMLAEQTLMNGSETGSGELFETGSTNLKCFDRCPKAPITSTDINPPDTPYDDPNFGGDPITPVGYSVSNTGTNAMTLMRGANKATFDASVTPALLEASVNNWGIRSGRLITEAVASQINGGNFHDPDVVTTWYEWETGLNNWNQLTWAKDSSGNVVKFDAPITFNLAFSQTVDRDQSANRSTSFDGQSFLMQYGGNGDLWGLPFASAGDGDESTKGDGDDRYYPVVALKDGAQVEVDSDKYVVKALEIEQKMEKVDLTGCNELILNDPAESLPTTVTGTHNTDAVPTLIDNTPSVVNGVVQVSN